MTSPDYIKEKEILVSIEVKLRLLDLEGVDLPATPPAILPPPPNVYFLFSEILYCIAFNPNL